MRVCTYAMALDRETDKWLTATFEKNFTLTVLNLESFYNYRTVGSNF